MSLRVIAGTLRSRTLKAPAGMATRPTAARARQALFSILGDVSEARVLDLYAGSGALGIEALSRGASSAVFVERDKAALTCIHQNLQQLQLTERTTVLPLRVESAFPTLLTAGPFDLVFCDPPWAESGTAATLLGKFAPLLSSSARVLLEHSARESVAVPGLIEWDRRTWGDTGVTFLSPVHSESNPITDRTAEDG